VVVVTPLAGTWPKRLLNRPSRDGANGAKGRQEEVLTSRDPDQLGCDREGVHSRRLDQETSFTSCTLPDERVRSIRRILRGRAVGSWSRPGLPTREVLLVQPLSLDELKLPSQVRHYAQKMKASVDPVI
jgi:hypothetical protein